MLREELEELKGSVKDMEKQVHEQSLALEMLSELKKSSKRWFVISIVLLIALVISNVGWLIYESSFDTVIEGETTTVDGGNGVATYLENSNSGDINYGKNNKNKNKSY